MGITIQINRSVLARIAGVCVALSLGLSACGDRREAEIKAIKEDVQRAYGKREFQKILNQAQKGFDLALEVEGAKAPDTLYFVQAITEANLGLRNMRGAMTALKKELDMRMDAGQTEKKLQARRTLLIKLAEENGDPMTAAAQAVLVAKGIEMGVGKDPQPVYRIETQYPPDQYRKGIEGDVQIAYSMDSTGAITDAYVSSANPPKVFDQAALDSFKQWRFTPMLDSTGNPKPASGLKSTLAFRLRK